MTTKKRFADQFRAKLALEALCDDLTRHSPKYKRCMVGGERLELPTYSV